MGRGRGRTWERTGWGSHVPICNHPKEAPSKSSPPPPLPAWCRSLSAPGLSAPRRPLPCSDLCACCTCAALSDSACTVRGVLGLATAGPGGEDGVAATAAAGAAAAAPPLACASACARSPADPTLLRREGPVLGARRWRDDDDGDCDCCCCCCWAWACEACGAWAAAACSPGASAAAGAGPCSCSCPCPALGLAVGASAAGAATSGVPAAASVGDASACAAGATDAVSCCAPPVYRPWWPCGCAAGSSARANASSSTAPPAPKVACVPVLAALPVGPRGVPALPARASDATSMPDTCTRGGRCSKVGEFTRYEGPSTSRGHPHPLRAFTGHPSHPGPPAPGHHPPLQHPTPRTCRCRPPLGLWLSCAGGRGSEDSAWPLPTPPPPPLCDEPSREASPPPPPLVAMCCSLLASAGAGAPACMPGAMGLCEAGGGQPVGAFVVTR